MHDNSIPSLNLTYAHHMYITSDCISRLAICTENLMSWQVNTTVIKSAVAMSMRTNKWAGLVRCDAHNVAHGVAHAT